MIGECPDCKMGDIQIKDNHRFIEPLDCVGVASNTPPMIEDEYEEEYESQETEHFNTATWAGVIGAMIPTMVLVVVGSVLYWIYRFTLSLKSDLMVLIRKKKYAIVIVRSVSKSRRKPGKASAEPISSNKSSCKSNGPQDFDPTIQRLETNRMSEELHVQFQVQVFKARIQYLVCLIAMKIGSRSKKLSLQNLTNDKSCVTDKEFV